MLFNSRITITASTPERTPLSEEIYIPAQFVESALFIFAGGADAVGARMLDQSQRQFVPAPGSPESWIRDNGFAIPLPVGYMLRASPFSIFIEAFNTTASDIILDVFITVESWDFRVLMVEELKAIRQALTTPVGAPEPAV